MCDECNESYPQYEREIEDGTVVTVERETYQGNTFSGPHEVADFDPGDNTYYLIPAKGNYNGQYGYAYYGHIVVDTPEPEVPQFRKGDKVKATDPSWETEHEWEVEGQRGEWLWLFRENSESGQLFGVKYVTRVSFEVGKTYQHKADKNPFEVTTVDPNGYALGMGQYGNIRAFSPQFFNDFEEVNNG